MFIDFFVYRLLCFLHKNVVFALLRLMYTCVLVCVCVWSDHCGGLHVRAGGDGLGRAHRHQAAQTQTVAVHTPGRADALQAGTPSGPLEHRRGGRLPAGTPRRHRVSRACTCVVVALAVLGNAILL